MTGKSFRRIKPLLLSKSVVLFSAVLLLLAAIGIAAAAKYAANREKPAGSSAAADLPHDEFYAFLESYLDQYGAVPAETPLHVADASGVIAAYLPAADEDLLICRIEGRDLLLERCGKSADGTVSVTETAVCPDLFSQVFEAGEPFTVRTDADGIYAGNEKLLTLQAPDSEAMSVAVIKTEETRRSWEQSSYLVRDFTVFRKKVTLPQEQPQREVPDVTGLNWDEAAERIEQRGLTPQIEPELKTDLPRGQVFAQAPKGGSTCSCGSPVYLTVAAESFLFRVTAPAHTQGDFTVVLYDESGTEMVRSKWHAADSEEPQECNVWAVRYRDTAEFQAVLENDVTGKTSSIGAYTVSSDEVAANSEITDYAFAQIGGIPQETGTTAPPPAEPEQPERSEDWKPVYREYVEEMMHAEQTDRSVRRSYLRCELIDIDGDGIPELAVGATEQGKRSTWICSIVNGSVQETEHFANGFWYLEGQNRIFTQSRTSYRTESLICELRDGQTAILQSFEERWSKTEDYSYKTDAKTITRKEYNDGLKKAFELPDRTEWKYPVAGWAVNDTTIEKYLQ